MIEFKRGDVFVCPYDGMNMVVLGTLDTIPLDIQNRVIVAQTSLLGLPHGNVVTYYQHEFEEHDWIGNDND